MKSIKIATLAILAAGLLAVNTASAAPAVSADGFIVLTVEEAPTSKATPKTVKKVKKAVRKATKKRTKRKVVKRAATKKSRFYRVKRGDTLTNIAVKTGVRFSKIVRLNRLYGSKKNRINVGQRLRLR